MKGNTVRLFAFLVAVADATVGANAGAAQSLAESLAEPPESLQSLPQLVLPMSTKTRPSALVPDLWTLSIDGHEYLPARLESAEEKETAEETAGLVFVVPTKTNPKNPNPLIAAETPLIAGETVYALHEKRLRLLLVHTADLSSSSSSCASGVGLLLTAESTFRFDTSEYPTQPTLKDLLHSIHSKSTCFDSGSTKQWIQKRFLEQFQDEFQVQMPRGNKWMAVGLSSLVIFSVTLALLVFWKLENRIKSSRKRKAFPADGLCSAIN